jgi:mRNA-degrading endonuclease RelE of RelBE toxin-antitoxin system
MAASFKIVIPSSFSRSLKKLVDKHPTLVDAYESAFEALEADPANVGRSQNIRKLNSVKPGDGQWRIRIGKYRIRYDIEPPLVILRSIKDRKDSYR